MGWFSELDIELRYGKDKKDRRRVDVLERQRDFLEDRLEELDEIRPFDPLDPLYDLYFYSNHVTVMWENPQTIQDILESLRLIDEEIAEFKAQETTRLEFLRSVLNTGATPDGQVVLSAKLFPVEEVWQPAA